MGGVGWKGSRGETGWNEKGGVMRCIIGCKEERNEVRVGWVRGVEKRRKDLWVRLDRSLGVRL